MGEKKWYNVKCTVFQEPDKNGNQKKISENYLVQAVSVTDAEVIITENNHDLPLEWEINSVSATNVLNVLTAKTKL